MYVLNTEYFDASVQDDLFVLHINAHFGCFSSAITIILQMCWEDGVKYNLLHGIYYVYYYYSW